MNWWSTAFWLGYPLQLIQYLFQKHFSWTIHFSFSYDFYWLKSRIGHFLFDWLHQYFFLLLVFTLFLTNHRILVEHCLIECLKWESERKDFKLPVTLIELFDRKLKIISQFCNIFHLTSRHKFTKQDISAFLLLFVT